MMDRTLHSVFFRWIVVLILVCTHMGNLLADNRGPNRPHIYSASRGHIQPPSTEAKTSPVPDPLDHPLSVVVRCHPDSMEVVAQADLFNRGLLVDGTHLRLGAAPAAEGSVCTAAPSGEAEFIIRVRLVDCGMTLSVSIAAFAGCHKLFQNWSADIYFQTTEEKVVYSNVLSYSPELSQQGLFRLDEATIPVECHYEKYVSFS